MSKSNIGDSDPITSIRFAGLPADSPKLSVVQRMQARKQIELSEKQKKRKAIKDRYPPYKVPNMKAAIVEAKANIARFEDAIKKEQATIAEFTAFTALCEQRDKELKAAGFDPL
jgi:hypothetical protein